jgi:hypothetical protein
MKTDYENWALPQTPQGMLHPLTLLEPVAAENGNRQIGGAGGMISPARRRHIFLFIRLPYDSRAKMFTFNEAVSNMLFSSKPARSCHIRTVLFSQGDRDVSPPRAGGARRIW